MILDFFTAIWNFITFPYRQFYSLTENIVHTHSLIWICVAFFIIMFVYSTLVYIFRNIHEITYLIIIIISIVLYPCWFAIGRIPYMRPSLKLGLALCLFLSGTAIASNEGELKTRSRLSISGFGPFIASIIAMVTFFARVPHVSGILFKAGFVILGIIMLYCLYFEAGWFYTETDEEIRERIRRERQREQEYYRSPFFKVFRAPFELLNPNSDSVRRGHLVSAAKGMAGEYEASKNLKKIKYQHYDLFSVYIPLNYNGRKAITEIDSIVITRGVVFCIEVKNRALNWLITYDKSKNIYVKDKDGVMKTEHNPLEQNYNHRDMLTKYLYKLGFEPRIFGLVVFGSETLGFNAPDDPDTEIDFCWHYELADKINWLTECVPNNRRLSPDEMDRIYDLLSPLQNNEKLKKEHELYIKSKYGYR